MPSFAENKQVAEIILDQIGGRKALVMIGANDPSKLDVVDYGIRIHLPRNKTSANRLTIKLEPSDTYTMRFHRDSFSRKTMTPSSKTIVTLEDVYSDQLAPMIESETGLYLRL